MKDSDLGRHSAHSITEGEGRSCDAAPSDWGTLRGGPWRCVARPGGCGCAGPRVPCARCRSGSTRGKGRWIGEGESHACSDGPPTPGRVPGGVRAHRRVSFPPLRLCLSLQRGGVGGERGRGDAMRCTTRSPRVTMPGRREGTSPVSPLNGGGKWSAPTVFKRSKRVSEKARATPNKAQAGGRAVPCMNKCVGRQAHV